MEMVDKPITHRDMREMLKLLRESQTTPDENGNIHFNSNLKPVGAKLKSLDSDAKDLYLCKNGEILFRMEE